jgi:hypothetical protein
MAVRPTSASAVSARLRKAGLTTTPNYAYPGILVSKGWRRGLVSLMCVQDRDRDADYQADLLETELKTWEGFTYSRHNGNGHGFDLERTS